MIFFSIPFPSTRIKNTPAIQIAPNQHQKISHQKIIHDQKKFNISSIFTTSGKAMQSPLKFLAKGNKKQMKSKQAQKIPLKTQQIFYDFMSLINNEQIHKS